MVEETCAGVAMTEMDCALLTVLTSRNGETATKEELYREVWGYRTVPKGRALDFAIRRLREKIEPDPKKPVFLEIVRGRGFRLHWERKPLELEEGISFRPPVYRTDWVGSREAIDALKTRIGEMKVLTLLGPAGVGKTRLLSEAVQDTSSLHWLRLHAIQDVFGLLATICQAYQVSGVALAGEPEQLFATVAKTLKVRGSLPVLVLDGAEAARVAKEAALAKAPDELARERRKRREAEMRRRKMAAQQKAEEARREMLQAEAEKLRKRREEEKAWKRLGVIPTRRVTWKGLVVDVDGTRGIGYYPKILRDLPKAPPK